MELAARSARVALLTSGLVACGGGGGGGIGWLFPLWIPTDIAVSDVDGDGRADIVTLARLSTSGSHDEGRVSVHLQQAGGGFAAEQSYVVETYPWHFAIADVDGDGAPDVVIGDPDAHAVAWLRQDPAARGRLLAPVRLLSGVTPYDVAVADLDDDGAMDVVATDSSGRLVVLPQNPAAPGSFEPAVDIALPGPSDAVAARDLDGDGLADLAVGYEIRLSSLRFDRTLATLRQLPGGGFSAPVDWITRRGLNVARLRLADYDGDGTVDVVSYLVPGSDAKPEILSVVFPSGGAASTHETSVAGENGLDDAAFGDFDEDGRLDAAVAGTFPVGSPSTIKSRLNLFRQSGNGSLQLVEKRSLSTDVSRIATGDVDGDGHLDLVLLGNENQVLLMLQTHSGVGDFLAPQMLP